ncbi:hypothetical protein B0H17DRAFT_1258467 [Mycena rosella]|uniref:Uncharacterized protein n=1 Tax=Mycena rosella TaxID=1033263 RepID=A0AAD7CT34_MYCRO|nr:hypothetical protein B0H17DRAFT_1258467 [Mycena rosella]
MALIPQLYLVPAMKFTTRRGTGDSGAARSSVPDASNPGSQPMDNHWNRTDAVNPRTRSPSPIPGDGHACAGAYFKWDFGSLYKTYPFVIHDTASKHNPDSRIDTVEKWSKQSFGKKSGSLISLTSNIILRDLEISHLLSGIGRFAEHGRRSAVRSSVCHRLGGRMGGVASVVGSLVASVVADECHDVATMHAPPQKNGSFRGFHLARNGLRWIDQEAKLSIKSASYKLSGRGYIIGSVHALFGLGAAVMGFTTGFHRQRGSIFARVLYGERHRPEQKLVYF